MAYAEKSPAFPVALSELIGANLNKAMTNMQQQK